MSTLHVCAVPTMTERLIAPLLLPDLTSVVDDCDDEVQMLQSLAAAIEQGEEWIEEARRLRNYAVVRLRVRGVPMTEIAKAAGVTDSYLAREAFKKGSPRRRVRKT